MKNVIFSALMAVGLMMVPAAAKAEVTIGVVDVKHIMLESNAAKGLQKQIKDQSEAFQAEFSKFDRELKDMQAALAKGRSDNASQEDMKKKSAEFEKKLSDTQALYKKRIDGFEKNKSEALKTLSEAVLKETEKVAAEKKLNLVLNKGMVIVGTKELDITEAVMAGMNKNLKEVKLKAATN